MRSSCMIVLLIIVALFTSSFSFFKSKPRDYVVIADEISAKVAKTLSKRHRMELIGEGGGMMGSVYMIGLSFQIRHPLGRTEARERIMDCAEELLAAINSNEEIRPFLKNYPFTPKNLQLVIFSVNANGQRVYDPFITAVSIDQNEFVTFRTKEPDKVPYKNQYREPYSVALNYLKEKKSKIATRIP